MQDFVHQQYVNRDTARAPQATLNPTPWEIHREQPTTSHATLPSSLNLKHHFIAAAQP